jgi:hypothetical protein
MAKEQQSASALPQGSEIAEVDRVFREMAASLARTMEELQSTNREMELFSYSVLHDLRALDGYARIIEEDCGYPSSTKNGSGSSQSFAAKRCAWECWWTTCSRSPAWGRNR